MNKNGTRDDTQRWKCKQCNYEIEQDENILVIPDIHHPFSHKYALDFVVDTYNRFNCNRVVCIGDFFDIYSLSRFLKDPRSFSLTDEFQMAKKKAKKWFDVFPYVDYVLGNHDLRINKRLTEAGVPMDFMKSYSEIFEIPTGWSINNSVEINKVRYTHGDRSGTEPHAQIARDLRQSVVSGHAHTVGGISFMTSLNDRIFAMGVGCLIDQDTYVFAYAKEATKRPVLGCGVVLDNGKLPIFVPME